MPALLIVESPAKAKTINRYLGSGYIVEASLGHVRDLPKKDIAIDIEAGFLPTYVPIDRRADVIDRLRRLSTTADRIILATDPDREGEAIAWHILQEIGDDGIEVTRVLFNEITERGVKEGMAAPRAVDLALVRSQEARRVMDRLIGYKVSPFLWNAFRGEAHKGLSAGRVQSVALRIVVDREKEINSFVPIPYWNLLATFATKAGDEFTARLVAVGARQLRNPKGSAVSSTANEKKGWISSQAEAEKLRDEALFESYQVERAESKQTKRRPPEPFTTSTLQQEASLRLKMKPKTTMAVAQKLYEGIALGGGSRTGLITYMRTDSTRVAPEAADAAEGWIFENFGKEYLRKRKAAATTKKKEGVQDGHEAIRPTDLSLTPKRMRKELPAEQADLYELIYRRFIASCMADALFDATTVDLRGGQFLFRANGRVPTFRGWLQVYDDPVEDPPAKASKKGKKERDDDEQRELPVGLDKGKDVDLLAIILKESKTKPPPRYRESTLVRELEARGIGRPSTYAATIATILDRQYVEERRRWLHATELGMKVSDILVENFPTLFVATFTAKMEKDLDAIASGRSTYLSVMQDFYRPFSSALKRARVPVGSAVMRKGSDRIEETRRRSTKLKRSSRADERKRLAAQSEAATGAETIECRKCGSFMELREGKYGPYYACTAFPKCAHVEGMPKAGSSNNEAATSTDGTPNCPECSSPMIERSGKNGRFFGCSQYPTCRRTLPIPSDVPCPACGTGSLVERRSKRGTFFGCSRYPDCRHTADALPAK